MTARWKTPLLAGLLVLVWSGSASAQNFEMEPIFDASFGWQPLYSFDIDESFPWGFNFQGAGRFTDWFGIAGDIGWNSTETEGFFEGRQSFITDRRLSFAVGPRFYFGSGRVNAFAHALVGGMKSVSFFEFFVDGSTRNDREEFSAFIVQPGLGVDFRSRSFFGLRLQLDYQWVTAEKYDDNVRFVVAAVFYLY